MSTSTLSRSEVRDSAPFSSNGAVRPVAQTGLIRNPPEGTRLAIEAEALTKTFKSGKATVKALDGLDLLVEEGTVLGMLGPNGAGKTTTVRILTTLMRPDSGRATVLGYDVVSQADELRCMIGLSGQYAAVDEHLTGRENLYMFSRLYQLSKSDAKRRADELLEQFRLTGAADRVVKTYSGGMRRRLDLAGALVGRPKLLVLDEPTTGLDPRSRLDMWEAIRERVREGTTLLLTTQYLEEADELAHSIAVVDNGRIIARGTADELKSDIGGERIEVVVRAREDITNVRGIIWQGPEEELSIDLHTRRITAPANGGVAALSRVIRELEAASVEVDDIGLRRPTLDDVFLTLTGHSAVAEGEVGENGAQNRGDE